MISTTNRRRVAALALIAALGFGLSGGPTRGQEPAKPQDEALDSLIEKLGQEPKDQPKADAGKDDPNQDKPVVDAEKPAKPKAEAGKPKAGEGDVSSEDRAVDDLLEKLGATKDEPTAEDRPKRPGGGEQPPGEPGQGGGGSGKDDRQSPGLTGEDKQIDEQLEELSGRKRKRNQSDRRQSEASGPMGKIIKEMRDIEERLGKPDTGDGTQGKQKEIVKQLETLIEQIRQSSSQAGKGMKEVRQAGNKPGDQPGDQPGKNAVGAPLSKPAKPTDKHVLAGGKDAWGHLPPELRQEIDNLFKEDSLPSREELIRRYYLSVSRKKLVRGE
ncbi:MAG: hypothetical protein P4L85_00595 [Paludisphaera borealis]|uniref:hypothetical protein n=1 Tax=Paludisphaera borealis TaxID=1387353 RepID=UPI00283E8DF6|nr:hypothetical protein [Paludisphaera borealis]MDR3617824.1 hypothetical protein [Paludisphaera borealis]